MMRRGWRALALAALLAGCQEEEAGAPVGPRPVVSERIALQAAIGPAFVGEVSARRQADLAFPVAGTLAERLVDGGAVVAAGDILAVLDPGDYRARLRQSEAAVAIAEANLRTVAASADRARRLRQTGVNTAQDVERAEQALASAQAAVDQARAGVVTARQALADTRLAAPMAGVVSAIHAEPGAQLAAGQPVLRLAGTQEREVLLDLTETQLSGLAAGAGFALVLQANPEVTATGVLTSVDPVASSVTRTRRAHLAIDAPPPGFRLGALVQARQAGDAAGSITLPETALRADGTVWRVERPAGTVRRIPVETGQAFGGRVAILGGLAVGDEIVVKGVNSLEEGQAVGPGVAE